MNSQEERLQILRQVKHNKCTITRDGDKLNVRGYIGFSLIGRTQTWTASK
ncbi:DUF2147 domain-containing protein [Sphingobacterium sp. T2]